MYSKYATAFPDCPGEGDVLYTDFYTATAGDVVIQDDIATYAAEGYNSVQTLHLPNDGINRIIAIKADEGTTIIISNHNYTISQPTYNVITTFGGASLSYIYGGAHDNVTSLELDTNDTYSVDFNEGPNTFVQNTSLNIIDWGGDNDSLSVSSRYALSNFRLLFDVRKNSFSEEWEANTEHVILTLQNHDLKNMLQLSTLPNVKLTDGINMTGTMERFSINDNAISVDSWCNSIKSSVVSWLTDEAHTYDSVGEAFANCTDQTALQELVACYTNYIT